MFDKIFKVAVLILFVLAILVYGMANRYQFFHISNSLTGLACNHYTGKCEWLSPDDMGAEKVKRYMEFRRSVPQPPAPVPPAPAPEAKP